MNRFKPLFVVLVSLALAVVSMPARWAAAAADQATIDKLVELNKEALEDYDTLEWDAAKHALLDALMAGKKAGLDNHPVIARTYIHLGAVYLTGFKNRDKAIQSFSRALEIDPGIQLSKAVATADVSDAFAEAQRKSKAGGGNSAETPPPPPPPPAVPARRRRGPVMEDQGASAAPADSNSSADEESSEPDLPVHIGALDCPEPDEAILEKSVTLRCALSPKLPVTKVFLLYRAPGKEDYTEVEMTKTPKGWREGKIPKKAVVGKSLQFYFEGRNDAGKPIVANGDKISPNIMLIVEEAQKGKASAASTTSAEDEDENPLNVDEGPKKRRVILGRRDTSEEGLDLRYGKRRYWIGLGVGSGYGYAKGKGLEAVNMSNDPTFNSLKSLFQPGLAWAGLGQLEPEFGYQINPDLAIALTGRLQWIPQPSQYSKYAARGALSVLAKLLYFSKQNQLRFFGAAMAGGGEGVRFTVFPAQGSSAKYSDFKDTVLMGPVLAGVGGGIYYEVSKPVSLVLEIDGLAGFPQFGFVGDVNAALQFNLY